jgi:hypothetical protein
VSEFGAVVKNMLRFAQALLRRASAGLPLRANESLGAIELAWFPGENIMVRAERTPREWFQEATRCYVDHHQGCAWCGGSYRVFQVKRGQRVEYYCNGCDFRAGHDADADEYFTIPGEEDCGDRPETMLRP